MQDAPQLLNDDGSASIATAIMMSHHAFRRDIARFAAALEKIAAGDTARVEALREEWQNYRGALHGHHEAEDNGVFPSLKNQHASLAATIEGLVAEHSRIDPLLEQGDRAFAQLPKSDAAAAAIVAELKALLETHLATEERSLIPHMRGWKAFPTPESEEEADLYAQGFAWSMQGVAADVLERVSVMLPETLTARLPGACEAFERRSERVWGAVRARAARTPIPEV